MGEVAQNTEEIIRLRSSDDQLFEVTEKVAFQSGMVKQMVKEVESETADHVIPLANVTGPTLAKVLEYCKHRVQEDAQKSPDFADDAAEGADDDEADDEFDIDNEKSKEKKVDKLSAFEQDFVSVDQTVLFDLMLAANYLDVKNLLDFLLSHVATLIVACKDAKEIREKFSITDDLPANEVEDIKKKHTWAFE